MEGDDGGRNEGSQPAAPAIEESEVVARLPGVRTLILRMTHDTHLTNDLTQEVLIAVLLAVREGRVRQPSALAAYMQQSARHIVYAANRKMQPVTVDELPDRESAWQDTPRTPLEHCEDAELQRFAREVLAELPAQRDRDLLIGFYVDGSSKAELMQRLALEAGQFDKVLFRARSRMRDRIREKMQQKHQAVGDPASSVVPIGGRARFE